MTVQDKIGTLRGVAKGRETDGHMATVAARDYPDYSLISRGGINPNETGITMFFTEQRTGMRITSLSNDDMPTNWADHDVTSHTIGERMLSYRETSTGSMEELTEQQIAKALKYLDNHAEKNLEEASLRKYMTEHLVKGQA